MIVDSEEFVLRVDQDVFMHALLILEDFKEVRISLIDIDDLADELEVIVLALEHLQIAYAFFFDDCIELILVSINLDNLAIEFLVHDFIFVPFLLGEVGFHSGNSFLVIDFDGKEAIPQ